MPDQDLKMIELSIEQAKMKVEMAEKLEQLELNPAFKVIFTDGYLNRYAVRLVELKASRAMQSEQDQRLMADQLNAIGHMKQYMNYIKQEAYAAKEALAADIDERTRILEEAI